MKESDIEKLGFAGQLASEFSSRMAGSEGGSELTKLLWLIQRDFLEVMTVQCAVDTVCCGACVL